LVLASKKVRSRWALGALPALNRFARAAQRSARVRGEVNVLLVSDAEMLDFNRRFRRRNKSTDVLSFSIQGGSGAGDIAVSIQRAQAQAREFGHPAAEEIKVLILHGMLHLAGHDHECDHGVMARKEEALRKRLGIASARGLISRNQRNPRRGAMRRSRAKS
jgi:probable rRNA maturation factor